MTTSMMSMCHLLAHWFPYSYLNLLSDYSARKSATDWQIQYLLLLLYESDFKQGLLKYRTQTEASSIL